MPAGSRRYFDGRWISNAFPSRPKWTTTREPARMSRRFPFASPTLYVVEAESGTDSFLPSTRFTTTESRPIVTIVPLISRIPPCAAASAGNRSAKSTALMRFMLGASLQKFFLFQIVWADAIQSFHLFELLRREFRKMPYEVHQLPRVFVFVRPRRHPGEADSILDDGEEFAVAEPLRGTAAHIRRLRVEILPHLRLAASVVCMT